MIERFELTTGYTVSRLIHGGWQFSAGHRLDGPALDDALDVLVASASLGVTTFDCADIYTGVEELYGRFLERWRSTSSPDLIQIHTKFVPDDSALAGVDRAYVERIVDRSLTRLGVERLDLVQYYWWRDEVPGMEQTALWLSDLQRAGKIGHLAVTNMDVARVRRLTEAGVQVISNQVQYSVLDRRPEHGLTDLCRRSAMSLIAFGTLAGGFLSTRWLGRDDPAEHDNRSLTKYRLIIEEFGGWNAFQALLQDLVEIGGRHEVEPSAVAIRFMLEQPEVAAVIAGATRRGQMERNARAFSFALHPEDRERIRRRIEAAPGPPGDVFALERDRAGPHGRIMRYDLNRE
jgi:aryl-alcohol dehydrogenase-like predicted oxidoreductase